MDWSQRFSLPGGTTISRRPARRITTRSFSLRSGIISTRRIMVNVDDGRASETFREHSDGKAGCQTWGGAVQRKKEGVERWVRAGQDITNRGLHPYVALSSPTRPRDWSIGHLEILCPRSPSGEPAPSPRASATPQSRFPFARPPRTLDLGFPLWRWDEAGTS